MRKLLLVGLLAISSAALAQNAPGRISDEVSNALNDCRKSNVNSSGVVDKEVMEKCMAGKGFFTKPIQNLPPVGTITTITDTTTTQVKSVPPRPTEIGTPGVSEPVDKPAQPVVPQK